MGRRPEDGTEIRQASLPSSDGAEEGFPPSVGSLGSSAGHVTCLGSSEDEGRILGVVSSGGYEDDLFQGHVLDSSLAPGGKTHPSWEIRGGGAREDVDRLSPSVETGCRLLSRSDRWGDA